MRNVRWTIYHGYLKSVPKRTLSEKHPEISKTLMLDSFLPSHPHPHPFRNLLDIHLYRIITPDFPRGHATPQEPTHEQPTEQAQ
jgi:hypothetical protein